MQTNIRPITIFEKKKKDQKKQQTAWNINKTQMFPLVLNFSTHFSTYTSKTGTVLIKSLHLHNINVFLPLMCTIPRREGELQVGLQAVGWTAVVGWGRMLADLGQCHLLVMTLQFAFSQQVVCGCYMIVQVSV